MADKILLTSFDTWLPHQKSNSSDDLLNEISNLNYTHPQLTFLRRLPVDVQIASCRVIAKINKIQPSGIICCGMAQRRPKLTIESNATWGNRVVKTSVDLSQLVAGSDGIEISHDAGKFVCECLYYSVLNYISELHLNTHCIFVHIPILTERNFAGIVADFQIIICRMSCLKKITYSMLPLLPILPIVQATPTPGPQFVLQPQFVRPLPGQLDKVPVFNSNSPELVQTEGILLSTFPPTGKGVRAAHLNFPFQGRFDLFAHHVAKAASSEDLRTLYLGVILHNPSTQQVSVDVLQAASYLSQPEAPFIELPPLVENLFGEVFAGPGSRVMNDVLRGQRQANWPAQLVIPQGQSQLLLNLPIPVQSLDPPINGRSTLMRLRSNGVVYAASLAMYARLNPDGTERPPTLAEWQQLLDNGDLAGPRDRTPTPPEQTTGQVIYGRVSGVAQGSQWQAQLIDNSNGYYLSIPQRGQAFSYGLSTVTQGRLGTSQIQSAPLLVRYPDTAYRAWGNYGVHYNLTMPLYNNTGQPQIITLSIQTPVKEDQTQGGIRFINPPAPQVFFRGTVRLRYNDEQNLPRTRYVHLVQRRGQMGEPLITLKMKERDRRLVQIDVLYPPDSTPPQVLSVKSLELSHVDQDF